MRTHAHEVGLRELRQHTREVVERAQAGEVIDITAHGRLIARLVPAGDPEPSAAFDRLVAEGRAHPPVRPGFRPRMLPSRGANLLTDALRDQRAHER